MVEDIEFLNAIYENAKMGIVGIEEIKNDINGQDLLKIINEQKNDYYSICTKAMKLLSLRDAERKNVSPIAKIMTFMDARMKLIRDDSDSNIAKMMIDGSNMGIIKLNERLNNYKGDNKKIINLAKELIEVEQRNLTNLKKFL